MFQIYLDIVCVFVFQGHEKCALLILDKIQEPSLINAKNNALQT